MKFIQGQDLVASLTKQISAQPNKPVKMCDLDWRYIGPLMPDQAMVLVRSSACTGFGNQERVKKLAVGARLPAAVLNLADRLATLRWPQRDHPYDGENRVLVPYGFLRYPMRYTMRERWPSFLRLKCGLGTA